MNAGPTTPALNIPANALGLELGSGHRPHSRADVLSDKYLEDIERGGQLVINRPFVQTGEGQLPFKDKVFDYIICRHVLEHVEDPVTFSEEVSRVGRAGYIETRSAIWEYLHPGRAYHRWLILEIKGALVMVAKSPELSQSIFGRLFETLNRYSLEYRMFLRRYPNLFHVRHQWKDQVAYQVEPANVGLRAWFDQPWDEARIGQFVTPRTPGRQAMELLSGAFASVWGGLGRRVGWSGSTKRRPIVDVVSLMQCPQCQHQVLRQGEMHVTCPHCGWHTLLYNAE